MASDTQMSISKEEKYGIIIGVGLVASLIIGTILYTQAQAQQQAQELIVNNLTNQTNSYRHTLSFMIYHNELKTANSLHISSSIFCTDKCYIIMDKHGNYMNRTKLQNGYYLMNYTITAPKVDSFNYPIPNIELENLIIYSYQTNSSRLPVYVWLCEAGSIECSSDMEKFQ